MAYTSLLTVIRTESDAPLLIAAAARLARDFDAHLDILCLGIDEVQVGYYFAGADMLLQQTSVAVANERAESLLALAEKLAGAEGVRYAAQGMVAQMTALHEVVAQSARYADLVVLSRPYGEGIGADAEAVLEATLFTGAAPVLVLPPEGLPQTFARKAVIGWNDGAEALRAARAALPLMRRATGAVITMIAPPVRAANQAAPGERLATFLSRHGVSADISLLPKTKPRVADMLAQQIADTDADLLVAGAYGHSRFRQSVLGGATRSLMEQCPVPLLMAH